ncbi:hypothetical protein DFJ74DRAFT_678643 [Hyaloraphidium curvatum]|nr:hypothetical protein DFJ74DRAFT_678643 [Hyaloraphidium curvatum]
MAQARRASLANIDPADDPYGNRLAMLQSMGPEAFSSTFGSTSTLAPWANASLNPYAGNGSLNPYLANASLNPYAANASLSPYGNAAAVRAASMARANGQSALALPSGPLPPADPSAFLDTLPPELKAAADAQIRTQLEAYAPAIADHVRAVLPGAPAEAQQAAYESAMGQYADQLRAHQAASVMGSTMQLGGGLPVGPGASVVMPTPSGWLGPPSVGMGMGPGTSVPSLGPPGMRYGSPPAGMGYPATGYPAAYGSPAAVQGFPGPSPSPYGGSTSAYAAAGYGTPPPSSSPANGATSGSTINTGSPGVPDTGAGYAGQGGQGYGSGDRYGSAAPG